MGCVHSQMVASTQVPTASENSRPHWPVSSKQLTATASSLKTMHFQKRVGSHGFLKLPISSSSSVLQPGWPLPWYPLADANATVASKMTRSGGDDWLNLVSTKSRDGSKLTFHYWECRRDFVDLVRIFGQLLAWRVESNCWPALRQMPPFIVDHPTDWLTDWHHIVDHYDFWFHYLIKD